MDETRENEMATVALDLEPIKRRLAKIDHNYKCYGEWPNKSDLAGKVIGDAGDLVEEVERLRDENDRLSLDLGLQQPGATQQADDDPTTP